MSKANTPASYTVKQAAELVGITSDTLRFYEKKGLLFNVNRSPNGHRRFSSQNVEWLRFIVCLKSTGMSLDTIKQYRDMLDEGPSTEQQRLQLLLDHKQQTEQQIACLNRNLEHVQRKIEHYQEGTQLSITLE
ncbi:MerR family transcriptional regulator [Agarivorans sp. DSG3-1]|uniref:MerR family transcriptional regulator n=1 Tax=Agarivorans sp. DSG3-1 TaxID=3342249 RepID=UPI00398F7D3E